MIYAYHLLQDYMYDEALELLNQVSKTYFLLDLYKDLSRALLCWATYKHTGNEAHGKESEYYLVIYYLTKWVTGSKIKFDTSGYFEELKDEVFKDFQV